jgi:hypothetical protein
MLLQELKGYNHPLNVCLTPANHQEKKVLLHGNNTGSPPSCVPPTTYLRSIDAVDIDRIVDGRYLYLSLDQQIKKRCCCNKIGDHHSFINKFLSHMSFYTCFDWFKKLKLFSYVRNLKIDVVLNIIRKIV